jgi:hypothetical protein
MSTLRSITLTATLAFSALLSAQSLQQKIDMNIDALGNAAISIAMTLPAQQWQMWNQNFGNNPSALKRDIERSMPGYFLEDFKLEKNDMERSFTVSLSAPGICKVDKKGRWILESDERDAQITELSERKFMMVKSPQEFGGGMQQTTMVTFPEQASNVKLEKDALGKTIFRFEMDGPVGASGILLWVGIALLVAGFSWLLFVLFR